MPFLVPLFLCGMVALAGCGRSPRVTFYTLTPPAAATPPPAATGGAAVAIGPLTLPEMVDRPQLVVREGENRVVILEAQRWAEPLKTAISRQMAQDLKRLLGMEVAWYPQNAASAAQYRVQLDIQRFEALPNESVTVEALWAVRRAGESSARTGHSLVREAVKGKGYEAVVAAFGRAVSMVSRDVAEAVRSYPPPPAAPPAERPLSP